METVITTTSYEETYNLGFKLGSVLQGKITLVLTGDLGAGKTSFVQGLARGLDVPDDYYITSPTYTLINEYPGRFILYHADLYRIDDEDSLDDTGFFDILNADGIKAVEWADKLDIKFYSENIRLDFNITGDNDRDIRIQATGQNEDLVLKEFKKLFKE